MTFRCTNAMCLLFYLLTAKQAYIQQYFVVFKQITNYLIVKVTQCILSTSKSHVSSCKLLFLASKTLFFVCLQPIKKLHSAPLNTSLTIKDFILLKQMGGFMLDPSKYAALCEKTSVVNWHNINRTDLTIQNKYFTCLFTQHFQPNRVLNEILNIWTHSTQLVKTDQQVTELQELFIYLLLIGINKDKPRCVVHHVELSADCNVAPLSVTILQSD